MLILADDLTGAADASAAFARRGHRAQLVLHPAASDLDPDPGTVVAIDVDSRAMDPDAAVAATEHALVGHLGHAGDGVFVKIDSTMRGHVRETVAAVRAALPVAPERVVVCPAFPAMGRSVEGGVVRVDGEPVPGGILRERFSGFPAGAGLFIAAASTDEQLAATARLAGDGVLWVGSAGLAGHVAELRLPAPAVPAVVQREPAEAVVVVAGSQHERTKAQLSALDKRVKVLRIDPRDRSFLDQARATIAAADGLVLTGGHTARAVLDTVGVARLDVGGEVEPGIAWAVTTVAGVPLTVVTKAGGFGDDAALSRAVRFLSTAHSTP